MGGGVEEGGERVVEDKERDREGNVRKCGDGGENSGGGS